MQENLIKKNIQLKNLQKNLIRKIFNSKNIQFKNLQKKSIKNLIHNVEFGSILTIYSFDNKTWVGFNLVSRRTR